MNEKNFDTKKRDNTNTPKKNFNRNGKKEFKKFEKAETPVEIDMIITALGEQALAYLEVQKNAAEMSLDEYKAAERELFNLGSYPAHLNGYPDLFLYMVERSVRADRETHELTRASCSIVMLENNAPKYYCTAYITKNGNGTIITHPLTENGPDYRNSTRYGITDGKIVKN